MIIKTVMITTAVANSETGDDDDGRMRMMTTMTLRSTTIMTAATT